MTALAIMQPYFAPYLGYWQLLHAVDRFVVYDDVQYMKGGWINRNRVLINGEPHYITVPVPGASPNRLISDLPIAGPAHPWRAKLLRSVKMGYRRAPHFDRVYPVLETIVHYQTDNLAHCLLHQLETLVAHIGIQTIIVQSSRRYDNAHLRSCARVIDICRREGARRYVNAPAGRALYQPAPFAAEGIELRFLAPQLPAYTQRDGPFRPGLSIIDALMETGPEGVRTMLDAYSLSG